jgi:hypothetical protein
MRNRLDEKELKVRLRLRVQHPSAVCEKYIAIIIIGFNSFSIMKKKARR